MYFGAAQDQMKILNLVHYLFFNHYQLNLLNLAQLEVKDLVSAHLD